MAWTVCVTLAVAALFYGGARAACSGDWPAPLDDVYIHYDFARAWATGHPFEWIAGQGYSSGETAPLYAVRPRRGLRRRLSRTAIGLWAALVACASHRGRDARSLGSSRTPAAGAWVPVRLRRLLAVCGTLDFAWWSGMEVALFGAALLRRCSCAIERRRAAAGLDRVGAPSGERGCSGPSWCSYAPSLPSWSPSPTFVVAQVARRSLSPRLLPSRGSPWRGSDPRGRRVEPRVHGLRSVCRRAPEAPLVQPVRDRRGPREGLRRQPRDARSGHGACDLGDGQGRFAYLLPLSRFVAHVATDTRARRRVPRRRGRVRAARLVERRGALPEPPRLHAGRRAAPGRERARRRGARGAKAGTHRQPRSPSSRSPSAARTSQTPRASTHARRATSTTSR